MMKIPTEHLSFFKNVCDAWSAGDARRDMVIHFTGEDSLLLDSLWSCDFKPITDIVSVTCTLKDAAATKKLQAIYHPANVTFIGCEPRR